MIDDISVLDTTVKTTSVFSKAFPAVIAQAAQEAAQRVTPQVQALADAPRPVRYPIAWKSERQRRAFFATRGFGKGIPYQRTGQTARGWQVEAEQVGNVTALAVSNRVPHAQFVYGTVQDPSIQQPFHVNTGWPKADEVVRVAVELVLADVRGQFIDTVSKLLEVRRG
jgi:hypothetical protein